MKTALLLSALLLLVTATRASADVVRLQGPHTRASAGATFEAPFTVAAATALGALQLDIRYDPALLEDIAVEPGAMLIAAQGGLEFRVVEPGRVRIALACSKPIDGDGPLFLLRGAIRGDAGTKAAALKIDAALAWQAKTLRELRVEPSDGTITPGSAVSDVASAIPWVGILVGFGVAVVLLPIVLKLRK